MDDPLPPDPYKALGIAKDAPLAAVRSAHRKLVLTCHPDKVTDEAAKKTAADKFHLVQQAYEILSDESKRQRYDERARLSELRAEMGKDSMGSRIVPEFVPRSTNKPNFEMRGNATYEEIRPRRTYEEDDYFQPRYQEVRPRNADRTFVQPPRRTSGRGSEDKRRAREMEEERDRERRRKDAARAEERAARSDRNKRRDRDKRRDYETKSRSKFAAHVEDESDSDSDYTERVYARRDEPPKRRYEDDIWKRDREIPLRASKREDYNSYDDYDSKHVRAQDFAQDYIAKSRSSIEPESRRPPAYSRSYSHVEPRSAQPPPPPPMVPTDLKRASGRGHPRREPSPPPRLSKKDRRKTEIVDPPPSSRRPSLPPFFSSDPKGSKAPFTAGPRRGPPRAQTLEHIPEPKHPSLTRAGTEPIDRSRLGDHKVPSSARAKEQHDSGYSSRSSRGTPDLSPSASPRLQSTRYKIQEESDSSDDEITIVAEPDGGYQRIQEVSPKTRRPPTTPHSASSMRMPPMRSGSSYTVLEQPPTPRTAPPFVRTESGRPPPMKSRPSARGAPQLYGEYSLPEEPYRVVNQSPRLKTEDGKHVSYSQRKGSEDMDRDAYPGSHHRPGLGRQESRAVRT